MAPTRLNAAEHKELAQTELAHFDQLGAPYRCTTLRSQLFPSNIIHLPFSFYPIRDISSGVELLFCTSYLSAYLALP
jgi:hypothetical protein